MSDSPPIIPEKLRSVGYRFIRILPRSKDPIDKDYPNTKNYLADEKQITLWINHFQNFELPPKDDSGLKSHFEGHGSYGVLCSDSLVAIDLDRQDIIDRALVHPLLKDAFSAQSGSGKGLHIFVRTEGAKTTRFNDSETKENVGHIKARGGFVVGPGCIHPSGGLYHVVNDGEIPFIPFEELLSHFSKYIEKKKVVEPAEYHRRFSPDSIDIPIDQILMPLKPVRSGAEIQGEHPIHGSKGGKNFSINIKKNVWRCWRCSSGGGPAEAIAVKFGLIDCHEAGPGCLRDGDLFKQVLEIAKKEYGYKKLKKVIEKQPQNLSQIQSVKERFDIDLFRVQKSNSVKKITILQGLPRESKTYSALKKLEKSKSGIYLNARHEVVDQAFKNFRCPVGKRVIKMEGKSRLCKTGTLQCSACNMMPNEHNVNHIGYMQLNFLVENIFHSNQKFERDLVSLIETEDIMKKYGGVCPYYALRRGLELADFIFTVPQIPIRKEVELLIIDEDPSLSSFFPSCVEICSFSHLQSLKSTKINIRQAEMQKMEDNINKKTRKYSYDYDILKAIDTLKKIRELLESFKEGKIPIDGLLIELESIPTPTFQNRDRAYQYLKREIGFESQIQFFEPVLYPAPIRFYLSTRQGFNSVFLIADYENQIQPFPISERIIMIGATIAERVARSIASDTYTIETFRVFSYARNFIIIPVEEKEEVREEGKKPYIRVSRSKTQKTICDLTASLYSNNIPCIVVTGTEESQRNVERYLREMKIPPQVTQQETKDEQVDTLVTGRPNIIYANSCVSRGIDLDIYDIILLYDVDFSTPYWSAMAHYHRINKEYEDANHYKEIKDQILIDETVNLAFRIAPVKGRWELYPKALFIPTYLLDRLRDRCAELGVLEKLDKASSSITISLDTVDIKKLGSICFAQFRTVEKIREIGKQTDIQGSLDPNFPEVPILCNQYQKIPKNLAILDAVSQERLTETLDRIIQNGAVIFSRKDDVPDYLYSAIRLEILKILQMGEGDDKLSTNAIIQHVRATQETWAISNPEISVLPDMGIGKRGRRKKYFVCREAIEKILDRMCKGGDIKRTQKKRTVYWSMQRQSGQVSRTKLGAGLCLP